MKSLRKNIQSAFRFVGTLFLIIIGVWFVRHSLVESYKVSTNSMETALQEGDYILISKRTDWFPPQRNDVLLLVSPLRQDTAYRPMFLSRCIGLPGDTIRVSSDGYRVNGKAFPRSPQALNTYFVALSIQQPFLHQMEALQIPVRDRKNEAFGFTLNLTTFEEYQLREALSETARNGFVCRQITPYQFVIPQQGRAYRLDEVSLQACREAILTETDGKAIIRDGKLYLDGKETSFFFFKQDYYWVLSDNVNEAIDSRHLGFVPADHLIGTLLFKFIK